MRLFTCDFLQQSCTARSPLFPPPPSLSLPLLAQAEAELLGSHTAARPSLSPRSLPAANRLQRAPPPPPPPLPPGGNGRRRRLRRRRRRRQVNQSSERRRGKEGGRGSRTAEGARNRRRQIHTTDCRCSGSAHPHEVLEQFVRKLFLNAMSQIIFILLQDIFTFSACHNIRHV